MERKVYSEKTDTLESDRTCSTLDARSGSVKPADMALHEPPPVGLNVQRLRKQRGLTLEGLAGLSGVSRSMLSQVERGEANPTLATVWSLSRALDIDVSELIGGRPNEARPRIELTAASYTPEIRSDDGLCLLRILSPADRVGSLEWYEILIAPGGALRSQPHARGSREHLTVLAGTLTVEIPPEKMIVGDGATARYPGDVVHAIINDTAETSRALLVVMF